MKRLDVIETALQRLGAVDVDGGPVNEGLEQQLKSELRGRSQRRAPWLGTLVAVVVACSAVAGVAVAATEGRWTVLFEWIYPDGTKVERKLDVGPREMIIPDSFGPNGEGGPQKVKIPEDAVVYDPAKHRVGQFERPVENQPVQDEEGFVPWKNRDGETVGRMRTRVQPDTE